MDSGSASAYYFSSLREKAAHYFVTLVLSFTEEFSFCCPHGHPSREILKSLGHFVSSSLNKLDLLGDPHSKNYFDGTVVLNFWGASYLHYHYAFEIQLRLGLTVVVIVNQQFKLAFVLSPERNLRSLNFKVTLTTTRRQKEELSKDLRL